MNLESNITLNLLSISILLIIYFHACKYIDKKSLSDRLYIQILAFTILMLGIDILGRFDGKTHAVYYIFNHAGNFTVFLMGPVLPSLWVAYVHFQVYRDENKLKRLFIPLFIVIIINAAFLIISQFTGWYYTIDADNVYHRGPLFLVPAFIIIMLMVTAFIIIIKNRNKMGNKSFFSLIFVAVPPLIGIFFQTLIYGVPFVLNSIVLSLLVVFLNIQNHILYTDYLTGVNNRKRLDAYLNEKVSLSAREKGFSAILIDIDNFKHINDTYGHNMGDEALESTANLLKTCLRTGDFIARYGGDEFCVVLDVSDRDTLEALVSRLYSCFEKYNESGFQPFKIEFSLGYAVYDPKLHKSAEEFLQQVDKLMYENKNAIKNKC